jgi:hypothetical protein
MNLLVRRALSSLKELNDMISSRLAEKNAITPADLIEPLGAELIVTG